MSGQDFQALRDAMVEEQLVGRGISDERVLSAFRKVPRHEFVLAEDAEIAYGDFPLPIGKAQTISQPYMVALMTQCLRLKGPERVLEIGTGSGYQSAILAELTKEVYSVERLAPLLVSAKKVLSRLGYVNCFLKEGDGTLGWAEHAPYDGIIVTAGSPGIPDSLVRQLKDGGRLVLPVGSGTFGQVLTVVERNKSRIDKTEICGCSFVPLIGKEGWSEQND